MSELVTPVPAVSAEAEAPVQIITPQDATAEHIARGLSAEQAKAFRANRRDKKAKAAAAAAVTTPTLEVKPVVAAELPATAEAESIHFDAPDENPAEPAEEAPAAE